ncbi:MAG: protein kinase [Bacteroidetes bacterium]|nr:protein kinase [Bacteroidota bacterium]
MIGKTISHFEVIEKLGGGGMGVVYVGRDLDLDRPVAMKFLPPHMSSVEGNRQRFVIEAKAASALNSPHICTIYEIGQTADKQLFIAMALYDGETLEHKIARGPLPVEMALEYTLQVGAGLSKAHGKDIIHRDVKPANIIVTEDGIAVILDFGLAKLMGSAAITGEGDSLGTAAYMSPEQVRGDEVDLRTDVWALGVLAYEMLSGHRPFPAAYEQAVIYQILNENPEPFSIHHEWSSTIQAALEKALDKNTATRFPDCDSFLDALVKADGGDRKSRYIISDPSRSKQVRFATPSDTDQVTIAVLPFLDMSPAKDQEYFCDGITEELITGLSKVKGWRVVSRTSSFAFKTSSADIREIGNKLQASHVVEGSLRKAGERLRITAQLVHVSNGYQIWSEKYDRELSDVFEIQDDIARSIVNGLVTKLDHAPQTPIVQHRTVNLEAFNLNLKARFQLNKRTPVGLHKSIELWNKALEMDANYVHPHAGLADANILLAFQGLEAPNTAMPRAIAAAETALSLDPRLADAHVSRGCAAAAYEWNWPNSESHFKRAIELSPNSSTAHHWYAVWVLTPQGRFDEALHHLNTARELDPLSLVIEAGIGWLNYLARSYELAVEQSHHTLELDENFVMARDLLGQAYLEQGKTSEGIKELEHAVEQSRRRTLSLAALSHAYAVAGKTAESRNILKELMTRNKSQYISSFDLALIYIGLEESDRALELLHRAYEERNGWMCFLNIEPRLDPLRSDPRFTTLLKQVGLA